MTSLRLYSSVLGALVVTGCAATYWIRSHRKSAHEREAERRAYLSHKGRITDGSILDLHELASDGQPPMKLLIYTYAVGGVNYECSQDITNLRQNLDAQTCAVGFPASIKYDPQNPGNSIVLAEGWTGLRH